MQKIVDNALQQTERVCALVKQMGASDEPLANAKREIEERTGLTGDIGRAQGLMSAATTGQRPLTKREREIMKVIVAQAIGDMAGKMCQTRRISAFSMLVLVIWS